MMVMALSYQWSAQEQREYSEAKLFRYVQDYVYPFHPYYRKLMKENSVDPRSIRSYNDFRNKIPITGKSDTLADQKAFVLQPRTEETTYDVEPLPRSTEMRYALKTLRTRYLRDIYGKPRSFKERVRHTAMYEWLPIHFHFSGGSTGVPSSAVYTLRDLREKVTRVNGMIYSAGGEPGERILNIFPALPHLGFFNSTFPQFFGDSGSVGSAALHTCGGKAIPTERQVIIASLIGFDWIVAIPSYLVYWLKTACEMKERGWIDGLKGIKGILAGAEPLTDEYRVRFREYLEQLGSPGAKIINCYGMTELKACGFECTDNSGLHLNPEVFYWEMLDPETREPVKEGEPGVLVFSHIDWRGTVFLRYWTGDLVQGGMVWDKCASCGLTVPRVYPPIVRAEKDFTKIKGARVPLLSFQTALHRVEGLDAWQVVIGKEDAADPLSRDKVTIYASLEQGADERTVTEQMTGNVQMDTEVTPDEVVFEDADSLESRLFERTGLKADWVVDQRDVTLTPDVPVGVGETAD
jgi:phenylacetate-CoA ligase